MSHKTTCLIWRLLIIAIIASGSLIPGIVAHAATPGRSSTRAPADCLAASEHPYQNDASQTWTIVNPSTEANYSRVHFSRLETETGYDFVILRDSLGREIYRYSGSYPDGLWSDPMPGTTVQIQLASDDSFADWGFCLDEIELAPPPAWEILPGLNTPRSRLAVVAVGGKLYAIGGETSPLLTPSKEARRTLSTIGMVEGPREQGFEGLTIEGIVEVYDPATGSWTRAADKPTGTSGSAAAAVNGLVYVAGGYTADGTVTDALEIYDPGSDRWTSGPPLPRPVSGAAGVDLNGELYVIGGRDEDGNYLSTAYRWDPDSGTWAELPPLAQARAWASAAAVDGKVYVVGGRDALHELASIEVYDPVVRRWTLATEMRTPRSGAGVAGIGNRLYVAGGGWSAYHTSVDMYDTASKTWTDFDPLSVGRRTLGLAILDNHLYAVGGWADTFSGLTEVHPVQGPKPPAIRIERESLQAIVQQGETVDFAISIFNDGDMDLEFQVTDGPESASGAERDIPWVESSPAGGVVAPAGAQEVVIRASAADLGPGSHAARAFIRSNDPARAAIVLPLTLEVTPASEVVLRFDPPVSEVAQGGIFRTELVLSTGSQPVDSVDTVVTFDPAILQVVDAHGNPAIEITPGEALPLRVANSVDNSSGRILFGVGRGLGDQAPAGDLALGTIRFRAVSQTLSPDGTPLALSDSSQVFANGMPVLDRIESGSVIVQATWFTGKVTLQGRGNPPSPHWAEQELTVIVRDPVGNEIDRLSGVTDEQGSFSLLRPPAGTFDLEIRGAHTLSNVRRGLTLPADEVIDLGLLREGDADGDGRIGQGDFSILADAFAASQAGAPIEWRADFNGDGVIGVADFSLLTNNFGLSSPIVVDPGGTPVPTPSPGAATLWLEPSRSVVGKGDAVEFAIMIDTAGGAVDAADVVLTFSPEHLMVADAHGNPSNEIIPEDTLPIVLRNQADNAAGHARFIAVVSPGSDPVKGQVRIATVRFRALKHTSSGLQGTLVEVGSGSDAYRAGEPQAKERYPAAVVIAVE